MKKKIVLVAILMVATLATVVAMFIFSNGVDRDYHQEVERVIHIVEHNEEVSLQYVRDHEPSYSYLVTDKKQILDLLKTMDEVKLLKETSERTADSDDIINVVVKGETYRFTFNMRNVVFEGKNYTNKNVEPVFDLLDAIARD